MYQIKLSRSLHGMEAGREERREGGREGGASYGTQQTRLQQYSTSDKVNSL